MSWGDFRHRIIDIIMNDIQRKGEDLNAKSPIWSSPILDNKGEFIEALLAVLNLLVANKGRVPTFMGADSTSYIDVTFMTTNIAKPLVN